MASKGCGRDPVGGFERRKTSPRTRFVARPTCGIAAAGVSRSPRLRQLDSWNRRRGLDRTKRRSSFKSVSLPRTGRAPLGASSSTGHREEMREVNPAARNRMVSPNGAVAMSDKRVFRPDVGRQNCGHGETSSEPASVVAFPVRDQQRENPQRCLLGAEPGRGRKCGKRRKLSGASVQALRKPC